METRFNRPDRLTKNSVTETILTSEMSVWKPGLIVIHTYVHHFSGAPRGAFQQPDYNKCKVRWLRVLARPLQAVHNVFMSETLSCALS